MNDESSSKSLNMLVYGPCLFGSESGYGGGQGGIVSAIRRMLKYFLRQGIDYEYCDYSVRSFSTYWYLSLFSRMIADNVKFAKNILLTKATIIYIVANGGVAVYRTLIAAILARILGKVVYVDVRGNALESYVTSNMGGMQKAAWTVILKTANNILGQHKRSVTVLIEIYGSKIQYHPNWFDMDSIQERKVEVLSSPRRRIVFVGYCYKPKGVFDIVNGCNKACISGLSIDLSFIGQEHESFSNFLDAFSPSNGLIINRRGRIDRRNILEILSTSDVFLFPSYHPGEGHPNVINEAMSCKLTIVSTRVGAIDDILDESTAYFVRPESPDDIAKRLLEIDANRHLARAKGERAFHRLGAEFSEEAVLGGLINSFQESLGGYGIYN